MFGTDYSKFERMEALNAPMPSRRYVVDLRNQRGKLGTAMNPDKIPMEEDVLRALLMMGKCTSVTSVLFRLVEILARRGTRVNGYLGDLTVLTSETVDPLATVEPLQVTGRPRIAFEKSDGTSIDAGLGHSIILICTSGGEKFVLDPTGEQYGVLRQHRFLPWRVYKDMYTMKREPRAGHTTITKTWSCAEVINLLSRTKEGEVWSPLHHIVDRSLDEWIQAGGSFDLVERIKQNMRRPRVVSP